MTTKLPAPNLRPPVTPHLVRHRQMMADLNDFYWGVCAGFQVLRERASNGSNRTSDFLSKAISSRWDVAAPEVAGKLEGESRRLRYLLLVQAVTYYEDYLGSILMEHLMSADLPEKQVRLRLDLSTVPKGSSVLDIRPVYAKQVTDDVLKENYATRASRLHRELGIDPAKTRPVLPLNLDQVGAACEARNCIVHAAGVADERALGALKGHVADVKVGQPLNLTEATMFVLIGALKDHVEAVDLLSRVTK